MYKIKLDRVPADKVDFYRSCSARVGIYDKKEENLCKVGYINDALKGSEFLFIIYGITNDIETAGPRFYFEKNVFYKKHGLIRIGFIK
jgi:hypothetical protein